MKWDHCKVQELKNFFYIDQAAKAAAGEETKTWEEYWESMLVDTEWADGYFIRSTAWYLEMSIQIMDTKCKEDEPFYTIDGDFTGEGCADILYIGYFSEVHYQSLLIDYGVEHTKDDISVEYEDMDNEEDMQEDYHGNDVQFDDSKKIKKIKLDLELEEMQRTDDIETKDDETWEPSKDKVSDNRCPSCKKTFKNVLLHIKKSKKCKISDTELRKLEGISKRKRKENVLENTKKYLSRLRNKEDPDTLKRKQNDLKSESRKKRKKEDLETVRKKENEWKSESRNKKRNEDPDTYKKKENDWKSESRQTLKGKDYLGENNKNKDWTARSRMRLKD